VWEAEEPCVLKHPRYEPLEAFSLLIQLIKGGIGDTAEYFEYGTVPTRQVAVQGSSSF
jgi:hypothetical protein